MSVHPLAGAFSVEASARRIRCYRYAEARMMRMLAGWIALTPELPVKLLFGRHVWECAQHADLWGRRLPELRAPAQESAAPNDAFEAFVDLLESPETPERSVERVTGVYRVLKPHLVAVYAAHLGAANAVYEPPTRRILERCLGEERRHVAAGAVILDRLLRDPSAHARSASWGERLMAALEAARGITGEPGPPPRELAGPGADPRGDLVALESVFDPSVVEPDLRAAVEAHAAALAVGDAARLGLHTADGAVLASYRSLARATAWEIVGQAKVGAYRFVKVRLTGPQRIEVVQLQWRRFDGEWRVVEAEVVRSGPAA